MTSPLGANQPIRAICVTYNPGPELDDFVASLHMSTTQPVELVLVDNGSHDQTPETVAANRGGRVVRASENLGYGRAANAGAAGADQPWLLVANPDIVWEPGSLDVLLAAAVRNPRAGAVGPALLNPDGTVYPSARRLPSLTQGVGHALFTRVWPGNPWTRAYRRQGSTELDGEDANPSVSANPSASGERTAGWLSGACLLLRREAFEQVGGFDPAYFMFFEDVDLGERLGAAGWENVYVPAARVTHVGGTSWRERPATMISAHHASAKRYLHHRYDRWYEWPVRAAITIGLGVRERFELRAAR